MTVLDLNVREQGSGLPLVLLHAFPLHSAMWLEARGGLSDVARDVAEGSATAAELLRADS